MKESKISNLQDFINKLEINNDLIRVKKKVDPKFELAAITSKFEGKQAILFESIKNSEFKVVCNILGTRNRFAFALGLTNPDSIPSHINHAIKILTPPKKRNISTDEYFVKSSKDLDTLPIVTHFEKDAGPYITSSIVYAKNLETDYQNSSTHRLLKMDEKHLCIRMVEGRHLHKCFTYAKEHGEDLKVAISIGSNPIINIAAAYQAAYGVDEMIVANSLLGNKLTLIQNKYSQLFVPIQTEIILEGRILKDRNHREWMVEMLKTYDFKRAQPVFELEKIRFNSNSVFYDILPGYSEHRLLMGLPVEAKIYENVRNVVASTLKVHLTDGGSNWLNTVIQIKKKLEGEPKNAILAAFAAHPSLKIATVVDEDIDPTNPVSVEYALSTRFQADKDIIVINNVKGSTLDPSSDQENLLTTKIGFDATASLLKSKERFEIAKIPGEDKMDMSQYIKP